MGGVRMGAAGEHAPRAAYLAELRVVDHVAVAAEVLLQRLEHLLVVVLLLEALHRRQGLAAVAAAGRRGGWRA
jgi:hypothetical protein